MVPQTAHQRSTCAASGHPRLGKANIVKRLADYFFFYLGTFFTALFMQKQDVIITLTTPPFVGWAAVLHKMFHRKTKVILWNMDCYPEAPERAGMIKTDGFMSKLLQFVNRGMFKRLDHMVGLDTAMIDLLMDRYDPAKLRPPQSRCPTTIIPNWEDADFFPERCRARTLGRHRAPGPRRKVRHPLPREHGRGPRV